jgi:hypothetical protein
MGPMNRRSIRHRTLALLVAALFGATMGVDALGAHPCPHHDGPLVAAASEAGARDGHAGHGPAIEAAAPYDSDAQHEGHGPCSCLGQCSASGSPALASTSNGATASAGALSAIRSLPIPQAAPCRRVDYLIPFATAPPVPFAS